MPIFNQPSYHVLDAQSYQTHELQSQYIIYSIYGIITWIV